MKQIPDNSVDMILCDLPYGVTHNSWDIAIPFDKLWDQYNRITKETSPILLFAQGIFYVDVVQSNRDNFRYDIVWDKILKGGFLNANVMPLRMHEQIAVFYKKKPI
jgi:site-specific DNA-methyltransferase (adenine-specific)